MKQKWGSNVATRLLYPIQSVSVLKFELHKVCRIFSHITRIDNAVEINDVSASWEEDASRQTLQQVNLNIGSGQLCALIGPVGAGKV